MWRSWVEAMCSITAVVFSANSQFTCCKLFLPEKSVLKINKMPEFYMILAPKINKIPEFYMIFAWKKCPNVCIIIARKIFFFRNFGPPAPCLLSLCTVSWTVLNRFSFMHCGIEMNSEDFGIRRSKIKVKFKVTVE